MMKVYLSTKIGFRLSTKLNNMNQSEFVDLYVKIINNHLFRI